MKDRIVEIIDEVMASKDFTVKGKLAVMRALAHYLATGTLPRADRVTLCIVEGLLHSDAVEADAGVEADSRHSDAVEADSKAQEGAGAAEASCASSRVCADAPAPTVVTTTTTTGLEEEKKSSSSCSETELAEYMRQRGVVNYRDEAHACYAYNEARGWRIGSQPIANWHWVAEKWIGQKSRHPRVASAPLTEAEMERNRKAAEEARVRERAADTLRRQWDAVRNQVCQLYPGDEYMDVYHPLRPVSFSDGILRLHHESSQPCLALTDKYREPLRRAIFSHFKGIKRMELV